jgi:hypothetical protein
VDENYVVINMDETAVQHEYEARKGFVLDMCPREMTAAGCFFSPLAMCKTRSHTTLVASICKDDAIQPHLPQILLPNKSRTTIAEMEMLKAIPSPVVTWAETTGWVNSDVFRDILTAIRRAVRLVRPNATIVLFMDGASQHISNACLAHAARLQIILVLIPSQLTWLLQPLDVIVFKGFKDLMRDKQTRSRVDSARGIFTDSTRIRVLGETIHETLVMQPWSSAFERTGISSSLRNLKSDIARYLGAPSAIVPRPLDSDELQLLIGRTRADMVRRFFRTPQTALERREHPAPAGAVGDEVYPPGGGEAAMHMPPEEEAVPETLPAVPPPAAPPSPTMPIALRTRSRIILH